MNAERKRNKETPRFQRFHRREREREKESEKEKERERERKRETRARGCEMSDFTFTITRTFPLSNLFRAVLADVTYNC